MVSTIRKYKDKTLYHSDSTGILFVHSRSCSGMSLASAIFRRTSFRTLHVDFPRGIVSGYLRGRKYTFFAEIHAELRKICGKTSPCNREDWGYPVLKARNINNPT